MPRHSMWFPKPVSNGCGSLKIFNHSGAGEMDPKDKREHKLCIGSIRVNFLGTAGRSHQAPKVPELCLMGSQMNEGTHCSQFKHSTLSISILRIFWVLL